MSLTAGLAAVLTEADPHHLDQVIDKLLDSSRRTVQRTDDVAVLLVHHLPEVST